jgi:hypothetical protein
MTDVIPFPSAVPESEVHAKAFRDLEGRIADCVSMAKIAADQIYNLETEDRELVFAVAHSWELLAKLKADYYAAWKGERDIEL